ncbi:MAG: hypothetical protein PHC90_01330 [Syntrophorhabdaceae bacterium]|nr:hypothetical protein [Syntrophorhabdaceae bacterium]
MKILIFSSMLMAFIAAAVISSSPSAIAASCHEDCISYCCTDSKCTKEKEAKCYSDCLRDCDNANRQPKKDKSSVPPS